MAKGTFWKDFKAFITRGNVIDMAVGVVIGGAFGKIVTGLVNYVINPFISLLTGGGDLDSLKTHLAWLDATGNRVQEVPGMDTTDLTEVAILWGTWIQTIIDFIIVAFCIFLILRVIMKTKERVEAKKNAELAAAAAAEAEAKAKADEEAAAAAAAAAAEAAEKQEQLNTSLLNQEKLLTDIRDLLKNK